MDVSRFAPGTTSLPMVGVGPGANVGGRSEKAIDPMELDACYHMSIRDEPTMACLAVYLNFLNLTAAQFTPVPKPGDIRDIAARRYLVPFMTDVELNFQRFGWCPYVHVNVKIDASGDEDFMREYKEVRDKFEGGNYDKDVVVPMVPAYGTYDVVLVKDDATLQTHLEFRAQSTMVDAPVIHVLYNTGAGSRGQPMWKWGNVQSNIAGLLSNYYALVQTQHFAVNANCNLAHPVTLIQRQKTTTDVQSNVEEGIYASDAVNPTGAAQTYPRMKDSAQIVTDAQSLFLETSKRNATAMKNWYHSPFNQMQGSHVILNSIHNNMHAVPDGFELAPNPPAAIPPSNYEYVVELHARRVSAVFGIPTTVFGAAKNSTAAKANEQELQIVTKVLNALENTLHTAMKEVLTTLTRMGVGIFTDVKINTQTFTDSEMMFNLYETGAIDEKDLERELFEPFGIKSNVKKGLPRKIGSGDSGRSKLKKDAEKRKKERESKSKKSKKSKSGSKKKKKKSR